jgi:hypothetical protein
LTVPPQISKIAIRMKKTPPALSQRLTRYGIGVGALSLAASAQAGIDYSGPLNISGNQIVFDLHSLTASSGTDATSDFRLTSNTSKLKAEVTAQTAGSHVAFVLRPGEQSMTQYALKLGAGTTIGSNLSFTPGTSYSYFNNYYPGGPIGAGAKNGDWKPGNEGFLGLTILLNTTTVYGWADVTLNNLDGTTNGLPVYTLHGFAYDDTGAPIAAGAIPEPSSIALLAAGAAGVLALKRRRK